MTEDRSKSAAGAGGRQRPAAGKQIKDFKRPKTIGGDPLNKTNALLTKNKNVNPLLAKNRFVDPL